MSTLIWTGATNGNFGTAGNYIDAGTLTTPANPPQNNDTVIFDRGNRDVDAGLTSGITGVTFVGLPGYAGRIAPASSLSIAIASLRWNAGYLSLAGNITKGDVRTRQGQKFNYESGTATDLFVACDLDVRGSAIVTNLRAKGSIQLTALANGTGFTTCEMRKGARLRTARAGVFDVGGGSMVETIEAAAMSSGTIIRENGMLLVSSSSGSSGTVTVESNGLLDCSNSNATITINTLRVWEGARTNLFTKIGPVTLTNPKVVFGLSDSAEYAVATPISL